MSDETPCWHDEFDDWDDSCVCGQDDCPDCGLECTHCDGEASEYCTDPIAGCGAGCTGEVCPCRSCGGSGLRAFQRSF